MKHKLEYDCLASPKHKNPLSEETYHVYRRNIDNRFKITRHTSVSVILIILNFVIRINYTFGFNETERITLKNEAKQMFYHAYKSYLNAYPADEILPISCQGRYRHESMDTTQIDESIGNFSLTLVDSLDMLVVLGDFEEFEVGLQRIIKDLSFDTDIVVSVFETNIRMLGGLLSAHILTKSIQDDSNQNIRFVSNSTRQKLSWYKSQILNLAEDLGNRLLPAFKTKTGIPHPRVNLKYGMMFESDKPIHETCTACAGSLILEFATLSRLTGNPIFEQKARKALDSLWAYRHKSTDLVGTVLNVDSGEWIQRESGIGAGSDSYYEYLLKAYILLGDKTYLDRFNKHYKSVMHYMSRGPFLMDVHMHHPNRVAKGFMDALSAFWPGLQVLKGDLRSAISTHTMFSEVIKRHNYLPEAFTTDLQVYWAHHQMRPEFLESTYFLYRATKDDYYLETGRNILEKLKKLKVACGFAGLQDVKTKVYDDKMASFVLAETLKYLYLLFSVEDETVIDLDKFIFSTEGHILPINLRLVQTGLVNGTDDSNLNSNQVNDNDDDDNDLPSNTSKSDFARMLVRLGDKLNEDDTSSDKAYKFNDFSDSCPSLEMQDMRFNKMHHPFIKLKDIEVSQTHLNRTSYIKLVAKLEDFKSSDPNYAKLASSIGFSIQVQPDGLIRLSLDGGIGELSKTPLAIAKRSSSMSKHLPYALFQGNTDKCFVSGK